jgi:hypothetical protein
MNWGQSTIGTSPLRTRGRTESPLTQWRPVRSSGIQPPSLVQELESLKKDVPNLTYELGQANSRIVHIIDSRLSRQKDYAMDRVIPSFDFDGTVDRLADGLAKQGVPISPFSFRISVDPAEDRVTVVHIKAKNLQVRDALSDFIPLDRQNKILWVARTRLGPGETSYVGFQGGPTEAAK